VALSYVWGSITNFHLVRLNQPKLIKAGSLRSGHVVWAATIRSAIKLVKRLGIQYLQVDSLYLIQNNPTNVEKGLKVISQIYKNTGLTTIAACSNNANAGLPRVRSGTRKRQDILKEVQPRIHLSGLLGLDHLLKPSMYETRA
jgi:hypothetical protein